jgi:hypothetical protein
MRYCILLFVAFLSIVVSCSTSKPTQEAEFQVTELTNLKDSANSVDYLVVCADSLFSSAQDFCRYRAGHREGGIDSIAVVKWSTVTESFVMSDTVLKDFLYFAKSAWKKFPYFILILASDKVNGDFHQGIPRGDPLGGRSDNYYSDLNNDGFPEFCLGRIPAQTNAEAEIVLGKISNFEAQPHRRVAVFSDDSCQWTLYDAIDLPTSYRHIIAAVDHAAFQVDSFELASYVQACNWTDSLRARARADFFQFLNKGDGFFCLIGHSDYYRFTDELSFASMDTLLITSTGIYDIYAGTNAFSHDTCLGKALLFKRDAGAVATISHDGNVTPAPEEVATIDFMAALSKRGYITIGELFKAAQTDSSFLFFYNSRILLGDPTMRIVY